MRKSILCAAVVALAMGSCTTPKEQTASYAIIPQPQDVVEGEGNGFLLTDKTVIVAPADNDSLRKYAGFLSDYVGDLTGNRLEVVDANPGRNAIVLERGFDNANPEAYQLTVTDSVITIDGSTCAGAFYGVQTLRKAIPAKERSNVLFPAVTITDYPRFSYRGAHFDVSRHFFPTDSVKSFIDMLALHNINKMHWHLTDDQGWRLEIKSRPKLAEIASKRKGTVIGHNSGVYDSIPYEGYYTQQEIRDIIDYAADRNIEIIPEIDLPGHMVAALTAYPELGCTGGPYEVWQQWGVSEDLLCAGNDSTLKFLDDVLGEVVELFPSKLVHIGGDECPKVRWEKCAKCQARIKELGLKTDGHSTAEQKLQSYVMEHAAKFLADHGRRIVGWDEILEGGMGDDAIIMSWRGENGGIAAAKLGHDVIMTPNSYLYFDYYQTLDRTGEPEAIGGYLPIDKVYSYEPYPQSLTPEEQKHIFGVQANLWTEYMPTMGQVQYMELPRMAALSEVQWTMPEKKDYVNFTHRVPQLINHYEAAGYNYATHIFNVNPILSLDNEKNAIVATLTTVDDAPIHYTLDGTEPTEQSPLYDSPVELTETCVLTAAAFRPNGRSKLFVDSVSFNKATARPIELLQEPSAQYRAQGASTLNDGRFGTPSFNTGSWVGWVGKDLEAVINLQQPETVSMVSFNTCVGTDDWIFDAREITIELSDDGKTYRTVATESLPVLDAPKNEIVNHTLTFPAQTAQYVKVTAKSERSIPDWHHGRGNVAFIFVDEIIVE